ncbi:MAG: hypothetical protein CFE21_02270 [Bacteroidetes bacterium B1(2017)]|nr:MAG: hypothetical protein CFE21_02270 [Bacteroidetes bacterium B1(2017)]
MQFLKKLRNFMGKSTLLIVLYISVIQHSNAQELLLQSRLIWDNQAGIKPHFKGAIYENEQEILPFFQQIIPLKSAQVEEIYLQSTQESDFILPNTSSNKTIDEIYKPIFHVAFERGKPYLFLKFLPFRKEGSSFKKLENVKIEIKYGTNSNATGFKKKPTYAANSVLASGDWVKIGTTQNGIYRIDYATLRGLGINPDQLDPRNIKLYGRGAGMVPQQNSKARVDDLKEIPILLQGESDGKFNPGDFIAFYGESQLNQWAYNENTQTYSFVSNLYCDTTYYFLTVGTSQGKRISKIPSLSGESATIGSYTYLYFYNNERANLIKSGKVWVGEEFDRITQQSFNVSVPYLITSEPIKFKSSVTARSFVESQFTVQVNGNGILNQTCPIVRPSFEDPYTCGLRINTTNFLSSSPNFTVNYSYNKPSSGSIGWLDFFEIQAKAELRNVNGNFVFKDAANMGSGKVTKYQIGSNRNLTVLDVSNPIDPIIIEGTFAANSYSFTCATDSLKTFAAYDGSNYLQVTNAGKIANQNLHSLTNPDGFIITHPNFIGEAKRLAEFHNKKDNLNIHVVNIQDVYNEFSSGAPDLCALRDFFKMFYDRANTVAEMPKYATLMGRASYDYKYRQKPNSNFILTFESNESFDPTGSYCSDDFLGFLDDAEGGWDIGNNNGELLDIGIGRLPVTNETEAKQVVDKIMSYYTSTSFGSWRNKLVFTADDEDNNLHQNQADNLANSLLNLYPEYNLEKIYLDAYKKESTAGGARFPEAQKAINNSIQNGCLIFNYTGHGGEVGLTAERVMGIDDINSWTNGLESNGIKLPLFLTATCEFSRFDDPLRFSAGELVLLNPSGGAVGLFTTVRLVFSGTNADLNQKFYDNVGFDSVSQLNPPHLGDIVRKTKNDYNVVNTRNFTLLGDPFLILAYPYYGVKTSTINSTDVAVFNDTLKALKKFVVTGFVTDKNGTKLNTYNGVVYPVVYDKFTNYSTLGNNPPLSTAMGFQMQNNVLYRGKSSVNNGDFTFSFVVPKDIAYEYGYGKISYYANNDLKDANGYNNRIFIGGTADSSAKDTKGPDIQLYLNDTKFVNGGLTNQSPKLIAKLYDENGINTTGRGIGRDLMYVLNNNQTQAVIVNDYYQATLNSYQSGEVKYDISNLAAGKYQLKFKAYDVYNNASESTLDFEVKSSEKPSIDHLLNYPNPFNNLTTFHFDHNLNGQDLNVLVQVFTVNGKLVKTLQTNNLATGTHFDLLHWDGKDEYGDKLANGVYIYKCKVYSPGNKTIEKTEKLVILN